MRLMILARLGGKLMQMRGHHLARKVQLRDGWRQILEARLEQNFGKGRELGENGS